MKRPSSLSLFWVRTPNHHEDCFVVSDSKRHAREFFEVAEGFALGTATPEFVEPIPNGMRVSEGYARLKTLKALGYRVVSKTRPLIYAKNGRSFVYGSINYSVLMDDLKNVSGIYCIHCAGSSFFKIGQTRDLPMRLQKLQTGCPYRLILEFFIPHSETRRIERALQAEVAQYRTQFEWFELPPRIAEVFFTKAKTVAAREKTAFHQYLLRVYE